MSKPRPGDPQVTRITTAPEPLADDIARRTRQYLAQMGVRVACFLLAVFTWGHIPAWISAILLVGAVVLPYTAVLLANAGRSPAVTAAVVAPTRAIGAGPAGGPIELGVHDAPTPGERGTDPDSSDRRGQWSP